MAWSYDRLWHQLIEKRMTKTEMRLQAGISCAALAKMGKEEPVTMETIGKICHALRCRVEDVVEWVPDPEDNE